MVLVGVLISLFMVLVQGSFIENVTRTMATKPPMTDSASLDIIEQNCSTAFDNMTYNCPAPI